MASTLVLTQTEIHFISSAYRYTKYLCMFTASTGKCWMVCSSRLLFANHMNPLLVNDTKGDIQFGCRDFIWNPLSIHVCLGLVMESWLFVGAYTCHSYSKLHYLCLLSCSTHLRLWRWNLHLMYFMSRSM